jgi:hypothetical protein
VSGLKPLRLVVLYTDGREDTVVVNAAAQVASERWLKGKRAPSEGAYFSAWFASGRSGIGSDDAAKFEDWMTTVAMISTADDEDTADPTEPAPSAG